MQLTNKQTNSALKNDFRRVKITLEFLNVSTFAEMIGLKKYKTYLETDQIPLK